MAAPLASSAPIQAGTLDAGAPEHATDASDQAPPEARVPDQPRTAAWDAIRVRPHEEVFSTRRGHCAVNLAYPEVSGLASRSTQANVNRLLRAKALATLPPPPPPPNPEDPHPRDDDCRAAQDPKPLRRPGGKDMPPPGTTDVVTTYAVGMLGRGLLSVVLDTYVATSPSAHPGDAYTGVTVDLASGAEVTLADLFLPSATWKHDLADAASAWADAHLAKARFQPSPERLEAPPSFYLKEGALVLVDVCGAYACRDMALPVPLSSLDPLLRPEWRQRLL